MNRSVGKLGGNAAGLFWLPLSHSRYLDKGLFSRTSFPLRGHDPDMGGPTGETDPSALEAAYAKPFRYFDLFHSGCLSSP